MTPEDKKLLLKDLCARLPYGVKVKVLNEDVWLYNGEEGFIVGKESINDDRFVIQCNNYSYVLSYDDFKPYLLPLSSMTEEQKTEYNSLRCSVPTYHYEYGDIVEDIELCDNWRSIEYLIANYFDFRGLIPKGLAVDATGLNIY